MQLIRSEIGNVWLHRAWHSIDNVPKNTLNAYRASIKTNHWEQSILAAAVSKQPKTKEYHKILNKIDCPVTIFHGTDDKLVKIHIFSFSLCVSTCVCRKMGCPCFFLSQKKAKTQTKIKSNKI